ncbi:winged helix-turn-helix domain-containing tetratricopeptide repeat protein [Bradyrhizobium diversitatis]|uniref:Winged helix-turn-helix domain-containing protein n=1 Tax=Bradyrhizobium diversitatis TaxID=2755406 RepID=A0ABS0P2K9_9BRAD|nr:winged helix-turn-helix domain-containing tetratricopeptide repeat protein [Bradyrhizobium diversitatis]MBH5387496.1 winged helix-turn-helix domain-containing protein [Bradyrhizobium diversitatis]
MRYLFEDYTFDTERRELHRRADAVSITPQVFDLLDYLIRNRERVVSKDDLINVIWNGRIVSDAALTTRMNAARSAIGDSGQEQRLIKTLPRMGFRFVGTVREAQRLVIAPVGLAPQDGDTAQRPLSPPRLSIVVLPFANLSGDPEQDYFVDGITESLTTDLSRISGSFVIGRHTAFTYKGKAVDLKQVGHELNVHYVLEGSVQRNRDRLRVNVQLVGAATGAHLWADRFDKPVADLFDMQDEIVSRLANTLEAQLTEHEARRSEQSSHLNSMDLYFQGTASLNKGRTPGYMAQAHDLFERALALDPKNTAAMVGMAMVDLTIGSGLYSPDRAARLAMAEVSVVKALSHAPNYPIAHLVLGDLLILTNRATQGIAECERALSLDRNLAGAHAQIGAAKFVMGRAAETEAHMNEAFRLSPCDINAYRWLLFAGAAKFQLLADDEAVSRWRRSLEANRNYPITHFLLAGALALLGSTDQAKATAKAGLALDSSFSICRFRNGLLSDNPTYLAMRERIYRGLRLACVPEG